MTKSAFKLVQVYSDQRSSKLAAAASRRLQTDLQLPHCEETRWNTELLRSPKLRLMAAREAAAASVVIIALDETEELSPEISQWLNLWKRRNRSARATLFVLLRRENLTAPRGVQRSLQQFATVAKIDFVCHSRVDVKSVRWLAAPEKHVC
jgi:hypothetical protein